MSAPATPAAASSSMSIQACSVKVEWPLFKCPCAHAKSEEIAVMTSSGAGDSAKRTMSAKDAYDHASTQLMDVGLGLAGVGRVYYTRSERILRDWTSRNVFHEGIDAVGLDTESVIAWNRGSSPRLSLVQLAAPNGDVIVVDVLNWPHGIHDDNNSNPGQLGCVLWDSTIIKYSVGDEVTTLGCRLKISHTHSHAHDENHNDHGKDDPSFSNAINVQPIAISQWPGFVQLPGTQELADYYCPHLRFHKNKQLQKSNWGHRPLSFEQLQYAAHDAAIALAIGKTQQLVTQAREFKRQKKKAARMRQRAEEKEKAQFLHVDPQAASSAAANVVRQLRAVMSPDADDHDDEEEHALPSHHLTDDAVTILRAVKAASVGIDGFPPGSVHMSVLDHPCVSAVQFRQGGVAVLHRDKKRVLFHASYGPDMDGRASLLFPDPDGPRGRTFSASITTGSPKDIVRLVDNDRQ